MGKCVANGTDAAIDPALLHALLSTGEPAAVPDLAARLRRSTAWVVRQLQRLTEAGCQITTHPQRGVSLVRSGLAVWGDYLRWRLPSADRPPIIQVYRQTASTQDVARRIVSRGGRDADGALAVAEYQTAGRGRLGRKWYGPAGSCVLFSHVCAPLPLMPRLKPAARSPEPWPLSPDRLVFATSVALARALEAAAAPHPLSVQIKWPNDLLIDGRKLAGILVEVVEGTGAGTKARSPKPQAPMSSSAAINGVGINVLLDHANLPPGVVDDPAAVTSLAAQGLTVDRLRVLAECAAGMRHALAADDLTSLLADWRQRSVLLGRCISARCGRRVYRGEVIDLDPLEGLILRLQSGQPAHLSAQSTTLEPS